MPLASVRSSRTFVDTAIVAIAPVAFALLSIRFELSEAVQAWTRTHERFQVDEIPGALLVLAMALCWYAWRRTGECRRELAARRTAEIRLGSLLADNRRLVRDALRAQEDERRRIARELHDELGQHLNAIKLDAVAIRDAEVPEHVRVSACAIVGIVDAQQGVVGGIVQRLRPPGLDELGLVAAIEQCVGGWRRRLPRVRFTLSVERALPDCDEAVNIAVYRLVQECLTNVAKHAQASRVDVAIACDRDGAADPAIVLAVDDDGAPTPSMRSGTGVGLAAMRERLEAVGGELETGPDATGFHVRARIPVAAPA